jgi:energy-coupling factor transporter transmembrane protein EcfT
MGRGRPETMKRAAVETLVLVVAVVVVARVIMSLLWPLLPALIALFIIGLIISWMLRRHA